MVVTMGDLLWSGGVDAGCRGGFRAGARLRVPRICGPVPGRWGETTLGRRRRPGDDGKDYGDGDRDDGPEVPLDAELAAALAGPVRQFAGMLAWTAREAAPLDHGERETAIAGSGRELQRQVLEATFAVDSAREERSAPLVSAAGIRHGTVEKGCGRGVVSIFGPVRAERMAYRNVREANLYPADARWVLPEDPYSLGMRALVAYHLAEGGYGQAQEVIEARTGMTVGRAQLAGLAGDLACWVDEFYDQRAFGADTDLPDSDVIMMQADGKGIAMRPGHRKGASAGKEPDAAHPGIKKMAEIVAVADFTPAVRDPEDIAAPPARCKERPGPQARDKWVAASITESIEDMIGVAFNEADRRDPERVRQRVFLVDGNKQQLSAIAAHAQERGLEVRSSSTSSTSAATSAKPQPRCTPDTRKPPANGLTGRNCACCTAAPKQSPPPWHRSQPRPAPGTPAWTSPTSTRRSPT